MSYNKKQLVPIKLKYEGSTPATPESGFGVIYFDNSSQLLYFKNAAGTSGAISMPQFPLNATSGSAAAPSIYFAESDSGIYAGGVDRVAITINGSESFAVINGDTRIVTGRLYISTHASTGYLTNGISAGDIDVVSPSVRFVGAGSVAVMDLDADNISCYQHIICRNDNTVDIGRAEGGTQFNPRNVYIGSGLLVGGGTSIATSSLVDLTSTSKCLRLPNLTSNPSTPLAGHIAFDTNNSTGVGSNKVAIYNGTAWVTPGVGDVKQQHTSVTEVSTTSSSETDLISYTLPANTLNANKDQIDFEFAGTMATGMGQFQLKVKFGGTTIADSGTISLGSTIRWIATGRIIRDSSSSTQKIFCRLQTTSDIGPGIMTYTSGSIDLTATAILKMTADVDDMMMGSPACVNEYLSVTFKPAA